MKLKLFKKKKQNLKKLDRLLWKLYRYLNIEDCENCILYGECCNDDEICMHLMISTMHTHKLKRKKKR